MHFIMSTIDFQRSSGLRQPPTSCERATHNTRACVAISVNFLLCEHLRQEPSIIVGGFFLFRRFRLHSRRRRRPTRHFTLLARGHRCQRCRGWPLVPKRKTELTREASVSLAERWPVATWQRFRQPFGVGSFLRFLLYYAALRGTVVAWFSRALILRADLFVTHTLGGYT